MLKAMGIQWFWPTTPEVAPAQTQTPGASPTPVAVAPGSAPVNISAQVAVAAAPTPNPLARRQDSQPAPAPVVVPIAAPAPSPAARPQREPVQVQHASWAELPQRMHACQACKLGDASTARVAGWGSETAKWLFVVQSLAPSEQVDQPVNGEEWVLLQAIWRAMKLTPEQVFVTSLTKCRALPGVMASPSEAQACVAYVQRQIALLQPDMVVALGQPVAQALLPSAAQQFAALGQWRAQLHSYHDADGVTAPVAVTYPLPSLLRNPIDKGKLWADMCMAMAHVPVQVQASDQSKSALPSTGG